MSSLVWFLLALLFIVLLVTRALTKLRKGHTALFWVGIILPVPRIADVLMAPTARAQARGIAGPKARPTWTI
jgi:hypothetical protein